MVKDKFLFITKFPERILPITFFLLCFGGAIALYLPCSSVGGISFLDAMFTATSASCVTGLSVMDIGTKLTPFGQFVLLLLIQAGGLGIMSISSIILILLGKRMSLSEEKTAKNIFDAESKDEIRKILVVIFKYTFWVELVGAIILTICFANTETSLWTGLKYGIFTSISAFCNAGFFLKSNSIMGYTHSPVILYTISFLIIFGGISPAICLSLKDLLNHRKLSPIALIVFSVTLALLIGGAILFFFSEYNGVLSGMSFFDKINNSWFQSATARTAGFNSVELGSINFETYILMLILMVIGGSPGGTAGGIKTTSIGILFLTCFNSLRGERNIVRNRKIQEDTLYKSITLVIIYTLIIVISSILLIATQNIHASKLIFETVSALGTVGLTQGITDHLNSCGRLIIICVMFLGRIFPATLLCYLNTKEPDLRIDYPDAKISLT